MGRKAKARDHFFATVRTESNSCLEWPYALSGGYGRARLGQGGKLTPVHLAAMELLGPPRPSPDHVAAHNCGNRACYNWRHLRWATTYDNLMDKAEQGHSRQEAGKKGFLSRADVREIANSLLLGEPVTEIANRFGCTRRLIDLIKRGERHVQLTGFVGGL